MLVFNEKNRLQTSLNNEFCICKCINNREAELITKLRKGKNLNPKKEMIHVKSFANERTCIVCKNKAYEGYFELADNKCLCTCFRYERAKAVYDRLIVIDKFRF